METPQEPPAGPVFDVAPAPPQKVDMRTTMYTGSLSHAAALRRVLLDPRLSAGALPAKWFKDDNPEEPRSLFVCGTPLAIPEPFDSHPVATAFEAALDRAEQKFRAGRKDKHIGGELGSIVIRKKQTRPKKLSTSAAKLFAKRAATFGDSSGTPSCKRAYYGDGEQGGSAKRARSGLYNGLTDQPFDYEPAAPTSPEPVDFSAAYRSTVKTEVIKAARQRSQLFTTQLRLAKGLAAACARDARKLLLRSVRLSDDSHRRARRILRDVLQYWKREDKDRQEEKKKLMARAEEARRIEAEEREAQRQKNKLKFLLGQSEAFSSFLQAKVKATEEAAGLDGASAKVSKGSSSREIDSITGAEDDDELRRKAEANAADLVAAHRKRLAQFDTDTDKRKRAATEEALQAAASRDEVVRAVTSMNGMKDEELAALRGEEHDDASDLAEKNRRLMSIVDQPAEDGTADGKPEVHAVKQPSILNCKMKDYQLRGLSWLVSLYDQGINGILADEMGLGKTLQTISFLSYLAEEEDNWGPFLVVSPKATLHNWQQEVTRFCPDLKVLPYWGSKADRGELRKHWSQKRMYRRDSEFQVCITSYEILTTDEKHFHRVKWQYLVLDEAQAIKNSSSSRWRALLQFPCRNRLLLTGTPLQNKLSELWSLLHFIMPTIFDNHAEFADWFAKDIEGHAKNNKILDLATLNRLRTLLDPFMLRRVKRDVESEMPPKSEIQLRCQLTGRQRHLYASIRSNIPVADIIRSMSGGGGGNADNGKTHGRGFTLDPGSSSQLMNIVMQLRKVCNHPETFERRVPQSPFQFQATPPPPHVPLPPAVLSGSAPMPPIDVTLLTRSAVESICPRALADVDDALNYRQHLLAVRLGLWQSENLRHYRHCGGNSLAFLYLCGGLSAGEVCKIFTGQDFPLWSWLDVGAPLDEHILRLTEVYGESTEKDGLRRLHPEWTLASCNAGDWFAVMARRHWMLLQPRARLLRRCKGLVLPGHDSPAALVVRSSRLLRSTRVFVESATAPAPRLFIPGDPHEGAKLLSPNSKLVYPGIPRRGSCRTSNEVYSVWRGLFGNFGEHVGSYQIVMPEAGRLVADSGKMTVLDPLLRRLRSEGHKCLIYSQFTKVLDILEDYCGKSAYKFVRLDGQSALADRRDIVAEWQANEELFIFLLSTRAGGVGLNLTAADTVIFFDSDWNPTQDLQAMDRAHRLGQERPVTVYRLTSRGTIEERMLIRAQQKSKINDLVIKGGGIQTDMEEPGEAEIDDIAALLIGEDTDDSKLDMNSAVDLAKRAADSITSAPEVLRGSGTSWERAKQERLMDKCLVLKPTAKVDHLLHCVLSSRRQN